MYLRRRIKLSMVIAATAAVVLAVRLGAAEPGNSYKVQNLVSDGFIYDPQLDLFKRLVDASRRANTAIYFVNSRGLEALPDAMTAEFSAALPSEDIGSAFAESFEAT